MIGPGKYKTVTELVMLATRAQAVVLMVIGGTEGGGFEVHCVESELGRKVNARLPSLLREMASQIEQDNDIEEETQERTE